MKQQEYLGQTVRRWMIQWIQFPEKLTKKQRDEELQWVRAQLVHGRWDFLVQLWCTNELSRDTTSSVKKWGRQIQLHDSRTTLRKRLLTDYDLELGLRTHLPDATIVLDLKLNEQAYRKQLSSSGKRYINKWKKANLDFVQASFAQREQFREVRYTTWYDKWFNVLPKEQFLKLRDYCESEEVWTLFLWLQDGKIVTGAVYLWYGKQMIYLYGGTDRSYGDIWAQYRLTDQIIKRWSTEKYTSLDLLGVAPVGFEKWHDRAGVTRFKQAFGGETISYWGSYDVVFNTWMMKAFEWKRRLRG